jgi:hypothetical protein
VVGNEGDGILEGVALFVATGLDGVEVCGADGRDGPRLAYPILFSFFTFAPFITNQRAVPTSATNMMGKSG